MSPEAPQGHGPNEVQLLLCQRLRAEELLEVNTVAVRLGLLPVEVQERIHLGKLPAVRMGGKLYVQQDDLTFYVDQLEHPPGLMAAWTWATATVHLAGTLDDLQERLPERLRCLRKELLGPLQPFAERVKEYLKGGRYGAVALHVRGAERMVLAFERAHGPLSVEMRHTVAPRSVTSHPCEDDQPG
ncbi:hypothetical protein DEDE109153_17910 [Deinococcus deserti]|uniref:Helix-turn-helix domain-containing protein n=1 Tax=Deinococcus deserti (strain DSM 17065 / CIP 109153 / LMG 22923 / VCD115) TaxID=546414 RepID=C1D3K5_DEIDV|nr:hypothetical protein [Deinococcus deserti]ACO48084.1 Hypothetical protein Deide_3p01420 [Deinococcus deserti VCD115]